jgi:cytidine deaminase
MISFGDLEPRYKKLLVKAREVQRTGFNPHTDSRVGAAILTDRGEIITASNIVPKARNTNICSETAVMIKANSLGKERFVALALIGRSGRPKPKNYMYTPCGNCRQLIYEYAADSGIDTDVIMANKSMTKVAVIPISKLLPYAFPAIKKIQ